MILLQGFDGDGRRKHAPPLPSPAVPYRPLPQRHQRSFVLKQPPFALDSAAEPRQLSL